LGNFLILEVAHFNTAGEIYLVAYSLVEFNDEGKIATFESFSDVRSSNVDVVECDVVKQEWD
jgi:hypothetical protein